MMNNPTIDKLIGMRLTAMADAYLQQVSDPKMKEIDFEDRVGMINARRVNENVEIGVRR